MKRKLCIAAILVLAALLLAFGLDMLGGSAFSLRSLGRSRPNILLITVETLRRDHCSLYGYERDTTPFLRELAKESIVFDNAWSHSTWTYSAMSYVLSGHLPERTGIVHAASKPRFNPVWWVSSLREAGYTTRADITNRWVHRLADTGAWDSLVMRPRNRRVGHLVKGTRAWLASEPRGPWCVVWHIFDPHGPYDPPADTAGAFQPEYEGRLDVSPLRPRWLQDVAPLSEAELEYVTARYDEDILHIDRALARLVRYLRTTGQWDNTCLILTADHGESFGEGGEWGHCGPLPQQEVAVPFLVRLPGGKRGGRRTDAVVGGIDVLPTLLAQAGVPVPEDLPGANVVSLLDHAQPERTLPLHYIHIRWLDEEAGTYRVAHHYAGEVSPTRHIARELPVTPQDAAPQAGDESVLADLRDLGYL